MQQLCAAGTSMLHTATDVPCRTGHRSTGLCITRTRAVTSQEACQHHTQKALEATFTSLSSRTWEGRVEKEEQMGMLCCLGQRVHGVARACCAHAHTDMAGHSGHAHALHRMHAHAWPMHNAHACRPGQPSPLAVVEASTARPYRGCVHGLPTHSCCHLRLQCLQLELLWRLLHLLSGWRAGHLVTTHACLGYRRGLQ